MENLKSRRKQLGMTQEQVSRKADIPYRLYQSYEMGEHIPGLANAKKIAQALDSTLDELFAEK